MRPAGENPDGGPRRQPQRGDGDGGDGVRRESQLALTEPDQRAAVVPVMKRLLAFPLAALLSGCLTAPPPPPPPYHAVGTEPFWNLLIDEHNLTFTQPDAAPITQPTPKVIVGFAGEIYQTPRINVNIVHVRCSDGMSDRTYPDKVQATVDGRQFNGCGGL
jgi:hypothetical protein